MNMPNTMKMKVISLRVSRPGAAGLAPDAAPGAARATVALMTVNPAGPRW